MCGSLERHRHLWLYLERRGLARRGVVLHIAPDVGTEVALRRRRGVDYTAGDLEGTRGGRRLDLTRLPQADDSVDLLLASHVLEHIEDDRAAFAEIHRVLRSGGRALLQVPMYGGPTIEDPSVRTPEERRVAFGQEDHVRFYGDDLPDRIAAAGLTCRVAVFRDELTERERRRFGLAHVTAADPEAEQLWAIVYAVKP